MRIVSIHEHAVDVIVQQLEDRLGTLAAGAPETVYLGEITAVKCFAGYPGRMAVMR